MNKHIHLILYNFKAHNPFSIDCNVIAEQTWLTIGFEAHNLFWIDCIVIVEQTRLVGSLKAHNLVLADIHESTYIHHCIYL